MRCVADYRAVRFVWFRMDDIEDDSQLRRGVPGAHRPLLQKLHWH